MWRQHRIDTEQIYFLTTEKKKNMDTEEKDILVAIYINLINIVNAFTNLQIDFMFSIGNYCK